MRSLFVVIMLWLLLNSFTTLAQTQLEFEIITTENAQDLVEIKSWSANKTHWSSAAFSPDALELAVAATNSFIEFLSLETLATTHIIPTPELDFDRFRYSPDGTELMTWNFRGTELTLIDIPNREILAHHTTTQTDGLDLYATTFANQYQLWNELENTISLHDTITSEELFRVENITWHDLSSDGLWLLTRNSEFIVQVWDVESGEIIFEIEPPSENVSVEDWAYGAGFTPDGLVWVNYPQHSETHNGIEWYSPIQFWDIETGEMVFQLEGHDYYSQLIFEPTNTYIFTRGLGLQPFGGYRCTMWRMSDGEQSRCTGGNYSIALSSTKLVASYSGTGRNVDIREMGELQRPIISLDAVAPYFAEFSPDSRFLITIDFEIKLWGVPSE